MNPETDWGTLYAQGAVARLNANLPQFQQQVTAQKSTRTYWIVGGIIAAIAVAAVGVGFYVRSRRKHAAGRKHKGSSESATERSENPRRRTKRPIARRSNKATKSRKPMDVQTLIFPKDGYTLSEAKAWATEHGHVAKKVDEKEDTYRLRQHEPGLYQPKSFRTITLGKSDVKAVVGKRKAA